MTHNLSAVDTKRITSSLHHSYCGTLCFLEGVCDNESYFRFLGFISPSDSDECGYINVMERERECVCVCGGGVSYCVMSFFL